MDFIVMVRFRVFFKFDIEMILLVFGFLLFSVIVILSNTTVGQKVYQTIATLVPSVVFGTDTFNLLMVVFNFAFVSLAKLVYQPILHILRNRLKGVQDVVYGLQERSFGHVDTLADTLGIGATVIDKS